MPDARNVPIGVRIAALAAALGGLCVWSVAAIAGGAEGASGGRAVLWSLVPPRAVDPPAVSDPAGVRNPIDNFILARLDGAGLAPLPEADRYALIRRVCLDITGLPPTLEQIERFVNDESPDAYEKLVDRLLASPAYGERMARVWLDLARYADTQGYEKDNRREIWRYRDWVIDAFNANMPFDRFTREQMAGDLLPDPTTEQLIATAFHRNTMTNTEGGTDDEEFRTLAIKDRVATTAQVWLGLTMNCAECHDHKYDPLTQREYYSFMAILNQTEDADRDDESPTIAAPTPELQRRIDEAKAAVAAARAEFDAAAAGLEGEYAAWKDRIRSGDEAVRKDVPEDVLKIVETAPESRLLTEEFAARQYFYSISPQLAEQRERLANAEMSVPKAPTVPILRELPADKRRETHIMRRGNFLDLADAVEPGVPAALHDWPADRPINRLGLAEWLTSPDNPLTARVMVNRIWAELFGIGLVETQEDFGVMGTPPSHPQLLDHLALYLVESGWDIKATIRYIVTSAAYRRDSSVTPELLEADPANRLLARGPRFRISAEMVRDQALAVSGLLSKKMHGPSVMPPQPDGVWQVVYSGDSWQTPKGEDRYRRSLYTFWRRTSPYPSMVVFDAPSREVCTVRRIRTNTPLQALVMMNDPVQIEAAQALARLIIEKGGDTAEARIRYAVLRVLARPARPQEVERLGELIATELEHYRDDADAAARIATDPLGPLPDGADTAEHAAWTLAASTLLNLDETLTKD